MLEVAFRTDLEDFLLDVDVFGSGDVTVISSCCFWELLSLNVFFREMTVKALNYERESQTVLMRMGPRTMMTKSQTLMRWMNTFNFKWVGLGPIS